MSELKRRLSLIVNDLTTTGSLELPEEPLRDLKALCKNRDEVIRIVFELLRAQLNKNHSQVRILHLSFCCFIDGEKNGILQDVERLSAFCLLSFFFFFLLPSFSRFAFQHSKSLTSSFAGLGSFVIFSSISSTSFWDSQWGLKGRHFLPLKQLLGCSKDAQWKW